MKLKKLTLHRETLLQLDDISALAVVGGDISVANTPNRCVNPGTDTLKSCGNTCAASCGVNVSCGPTKCDATCAATCMTCGVSCGSCGFCPSQGTCGASCGCSANSCAGTCAGCGTANTIN